jgi:hypothetical protein
MGPTETVTAPVFLRTAPIWNIVHSKAVAEEGMPVLGGVSPAVAGSTPRDARRSKVEVPVGFRLTLVFSCIERPNTRPQVTSGNMSALCK